MADLFSGVSAQSTPSVFNFGAHTVRIVLRDGEPWFVASDVCGALLYKNTSDAVATHLDDDERSTIANSESRNGGGSLVIINESGLYALVLRSRKPEARKFAKWVTGEVLPTIRKTGRYEQPSAQPQATLRGRRWLIETDANGVETVHPIGPDDFIATWDRMVKDVASGDFLRSSAELVAMANACTSRLQHRMCQDASRSNAVLFQHTSPGRLERVVTHA